MEEKTKEFMSRILLPSLSVVFSLVITIGGWIMASKIQSALLEERIAIMQKDMTRHEMEKGEQIRLNAMRAEEHEKRIVRLEANFELIQATLIEMREDLKTLVRGARN